MVLNKKKKKKREMEMVTKPAERMEKVPILTLKRVRPTLAVTVPIQTDQNPIHHSMNHHQGPSHRLSTNYPKMKGHFRIRLHT